MIWAAFAITKKTHKKTQYCDHYGASSGDQGIVKVSDGGCVLHFFLLSFSIFGKLLDEDFFLGLFLFMVFDFFFRSF